MRLSPLIYLIQAGSAAPSLPENAVAIAQIPSRAFGDGSHPTTRLCAGAVDLTCRQAKPKRVLDVGTGTGVLARIARARGASAIKATDIDLEALEAARSNAALDSHPVEIQMSSDLPDHWGPVFDLAVANILEGPLRSLAPHLVRALSPGGLLLLSGFTPLQIPSLRTTYTGLGLHYVNESVLDGWALLALSNPVNSVSP